jgi:hypothetical protein
MCSVMLRSQGPGVAVLGIVMNTKELGVYAAQFWATSTILLPMIGEYNAVFKGLLTVDDLHEQVRKHIFVPFYTKTDHFTKTGSGRKGEKLEKESGVFLSCRSSVWLSGTRSALQTQP